MKELLDKFSLKTLLKAAKLSKSTYYYWANQKVENKDEEAEQLIKSVCEQHKNYGYRRVTSELRRLGTIMNKKKAQRIMKKLGLQVMSYTRKSRKYNSYKGQISKIAKNRLNRRFYSTVLHQKIMTDTTEFKYWKVGKNGELVVGKLYLDPYMDAYNREIVSWRISKHPNMESMLKGLQEAIEATSDCKYRRTFHSDQGWAYQMSGYKALLKENKIYQSMSRKGNCLDNSLIENFFGLMKQEMYYGKTYHSYEELALAINEYIEYYNYERIKETLHWMSPVEYRLSHAS